MEGKKFLIVFLLALGLFSVTARAEADKNVEELLACSLRIARDLGNPIEKTIALDYIATEYSDIGQREKSSKILSQAYHSAMKIKGKDASEKYTMLGYVAGKYAEIGEYTRALQVAGKIKYEYHKDKALVAIGEKCADEGQFDIALEIVEIIKGRYGKASVLEKIAQGYEKIGKHDEALQINKTVENLRKDVISPLAKKFWVCVDAGKYDDAIQVANTMENDRKAPLLAEIAVRYAKSGQKDKALQMLSQAVGVASVVESVNNKEWTLADIALKYAEIEEYDEAIKLAQSINGVWAKDRALRDISREYARKGQYEKAIQLTTTIKESITKGMALFWISLEYVQTGQYLQAIQVIETIDDDDFQKSLGLSYIAEKYYEKGEKDKAAELLSKALEVTRATQNPHMKAMELAEIAGKYTKTGLKMDDRAKEILNEMKKR